jgi:hypothetical protein
MTTVRHNPDLLLLPAIRRRLKAEADFEDGPGIYWAVMVRADGMPRVETFMGLSITPVPEQVMFAHDMVEALNKHLHHDGAWIVAYTHPNERQTVLDTFTTFGRFIFLWLDADADPQFTIECSQSLFHEVLEKGPDYWMAEAERHWSTWDRQMRQVLDRKIRSIATFKQAQGQGAPSNGRYPVN